ncbi:hypothetical protein DW095_13730 [Bacteroides sp. AM07-16]|nr:hypothetical protein DW095_13730 [Bacteroides sp. AM07-16]
MLNLYKEIKMKRTAYILMFIFLVGTMMSSCLNEDDVKAPKVHSLKFYTINENKEFIEELNPVSGITYTIGVDTDADICSLWPGGIRQIVKKVGTDIDSTDVNGNVVLSKSDCYKDYGLLKAQGLKTSLNSTIGWTATYQYPQSGEFEFTVVVTNHGYDSPDYKQVAVPFNVKIR